MITAQDRRARMFLVDSLHAPHAPSHLNKLIRAYRMRIPSDAVQLGPFVRRGANVGRPLSQEELAEAIGVSHQFYAMTELSPSARVSIGLLIRLAEVLMLGTAERKMLFRLAMPEISDFKR